MDNDTYRKIIEANKELHRIESKDYEALHPEEFNSFEQRRMQNELAFILKHLPHNIKVLDIGCGTGNIALKLLAMSNCSIWGVDLSDDMLAELKKKVSRADETRIKLICQNLDDFIAQCSERFEFIAISSVLHHLPDYGATLSKCLALLKSGGWLYITHEPTKEALERDPFLRKILWQADYFFYALFNSAQIRHTPQRDYRMSDYHLYRGFDEEKVIAVCRNAGLRNVRFFKYASAMRLSLSCWIDTCVLKSKRQFCLVATKD